MTIECANRWIATLQADTELRGKAESVGDEEALVKLAREHGFEFTSEELKCAVAAMQNELSDEELDNVAGGDGCSSAGPTTPITNYTPVADNGIDEII